MYNFALFILTTTLFISCKPEPVAIQFGHDSCDYCKMVIMDPKFGAELVTTKGKAFKFDDINCLLNYAEENQLSPEMVAHWLVIDFSKPESFIPADKAFYTRSVSIMSPMASRIASFSNEETRATMNANWQEPENITWNTVKQTFK
jgi:copper chaperone NosL